MSNPSEVKIKKQERGPCGCVVIHYEDGANHYEPCLICALAQAGRMLQAASNRLREEAQAQAEADVPKGPTLFDGAGGEL